MNHLTTYKLFEFVDFMAGSKVVKDGKPLVVYHGTKAKFKKFDKSWSGQTDEGFYGPGFYFSADQEEAKEYGPVLVKANLMISNPFYLKSWSTVGSWMEMDLRDDLAELKGMPKDLKTDRKIPEGYYMKKEDNKDHVSYSVHPTEKFYGTDKEVYGPEVKVTLEEDKKSNGKYEELAVVEFNDMVNEVSYSTGLTNWLLQEVGRDKLDEIMTANGYDGIFVVGEKGDKTPIDEVSEFIVWDPENIRMVE